MRVSQLSDFLQRETQVLALLDETDNFQITLAAIALATGRSRQRAQQPLPLVET